MHILLRLPPPRLQVTRYRFCARPATHSAREVFLSFVQVHIYPAFAQIGYM